MDFARLAEWGRRPFERHETFVAPDSRQAPLAERIERRRRVLRTLTAAQH